MNNDEFSEKGILLSKFEFIVYLIASIEYALHLLFLEGEFDYRFYIFIIYACSIMSFLNMLFMRKAFNKFLLLKARLELTRIPCLSILEPLQDKNS